MSTVLYISSSSKIGGAERSLVSLLNNLDTSRYAPVVVLPEEGPLYEELKNDFPLEIVPMRRITRSRNPIALVSYALNLCRSVRRLSLIIRRRGVRLIHCNTASAHLFGGIAGRLHRLPVIWHVRDVAPLGIFGKLLFGLSSWVVVTSRFVAEEVSRYAGSAGRGKIVLIYNGVDVRGARPAGAQAGLEGGGRLRESCGLAPHAPTVAMVGQIVPWKRHADFIRAAGNILNEVPGAAFFLVGEDLFGDHAAYEDELRRTVVALGLERHFIFTGYCKDVAALLSQIDVLVHPAACEPFGRVIVEAMALGKPVVAVDSGGPAEIVVHDWTGCLVPPGDVRAMAEAVIGLLRDADRRRLMGERARKRVHEAFDIVKHTSAVMDVYERCC